MPDLRQLEGGTAIQSSRIYRTIHQARPGFHYCTERPQILKPSGGRFAPNRKHIRKAGIASSVAYFRTTQAGFNFGKNVGLQNRCCFQRPLQREFA